MTTRILYTLRAWLYYIKNCNRAAYLALLLVVLFSAFTAARFFYNAGVYDAMRHCKVYAESRVTLVYNGHVVNR